MVPLRPELLVLARSPRAAMLLGTISAWRFGMDANDPRKRETEALIEAIWGPAAVAAPAPLDAEARAAQNRALAEAMRAYLQQYLAET